MSVSYQKGINQQTQQLELQGYGYFVKIKDAEGNWWVYAHLNGTDADPSGVGLKVGDTVTVGNKIGLCDTSGQSTGAHLHLEYRLGGEWGTKTCPSAKLPLAGC
jgi:murein DD-endopeptidase MepM/ murein hydrolase activator NlpD